MASPGHATDHDHGRSASRVSRLVSRFESSTTPDTAHQPPVYVDRPHRLPPGLLIRRPLPAVLSTAVSNDTRHGRAESIVERNVRRFSSSSPPPPPTRHHSILLPTPIDAPILPSSSHAVEGKVSEMDWRRKSRRRIRNDVEVQRAESTTAACELRTGLARDPSIDAATPAAVIPDPIPPVLETSSARIDEKVYSQTFLLETTPTLSNPFDDPLCPLPAYTDPTSLTSPFVDPLPFDENDSLSLLNNPDSSSSTPSALRTVPVSSTLVSPHELFKAGALPLNLPRLDEYLRSNFELIRFGDIESEGLMSQEEQDSWDIWIRDRSKDNDATKRWGSKIRRIFSRHKGASRDATAAIMMAGKQSDRYEEIEKQSLSSARSAADAPSAILPPMHLLPPSLTITDLKRNMSTPAPILSLDAALSIAIDGVLGAEGSNYGISLAKVEVFRDLVQMMSVLLYHTTVTGPTSSFHTATSFLAGDFLSAFGYAIVWLYAFTLLAAFFVYEVYRFTGGWRCQENWKRADHGEGYDREWIAPDGRARSNKTQMMETKWYSRLRVRMHWREARWYKILVTFSATTLYLPLSRIAISALVWGDDYWTPALDSTSSFCYRTTLSTSTFNWAYIILPIAASTIVWLSIFLPHRLHLITRLSVPTIDRYTELGERRRDSAAEYERLLERSKSPFSFLFNEYRRSHASYKSIYMLVKLTNVVLIVVLSTSNCLFLNRSPAFVAVIRQSCQLVVMSLFLAASLFVKPFIAPLSNASDRVSRIAYVIVALLGLLVALNVSGDSVFAGPLMTLVEVVSYSFSGYFAVISTAYAQQIIKRLSHRLDFSVDVFSPSLPLSKHIAVRIYQETLSLLLLTSSETRMKKNHVLLFSEVDADSLEPPYLLNFRRTVAERHVENLQILRSIGMERYLQGVSSSDKYGPTLHKSLSYHTGPDAVWHPANCHRPFGSSVFGRLDIIPFPFTAVFRYDDGKCTSECSRPIMLTAFEDLELLLRQNESSDVVQRKRIRRALRAMDGQLILAPHEAIISASTERTKLGRRITVARRVSYTRAIFRIGRNSKIEWGDDAGRYNYSSGFDISLHYSDGQSIAEDGRLRTGLALVLSGADFGIVEDDFGLAPNLARLLTSNRSIIERRSPDIERALRLHQDWYRMEHESKRSTLTYAFLVNIFASPTLTPSELYRPLQAESNPTMRSFIHRSSASIRYLEERSRIVNSSHVRRFWYLLFDDLWRRNHVDYPLLQQNESSFSPYYRNSICYSVLSRSELQDFLDCRGFLAKKTGGSSWFNSGFLNKIYFYLDEVVFEEMNRSIPIHLNHSALPISFASLDPESHLPIDHHRRTTTTIAADGAGGTIEHNDPLIRFRSSFPFESLLDSHSSATRSPWIIAAMDSVKQSTMEWLGLSIRRRPREKSAAEILFELSKSSEGWVGFETQIK